MYRPVNISCLLKKFDTEKTPYGYRSGCLAIATNLSTNMGGTIPKSFSSCLTLFAPASLERGWKGQESQVPKMGNLMLSNPSWWFIPTRFEQKYALCKSNWIISPNKIGVKIPKTLFVDQPPPSFG